MQNLLRRSLFAPLQYWRTMGLVLIVAFAVTSVFRDVLAVLLSTLACAFVFRPYEQRRWIAIFMEASVGYIVLRLILAFAATSSVYGIATTAA